MHLDLLSNQFAKWYGFTRLPMQIEMYIAGFVSMQLTIQLVESISKPLNKAPPV